MDGQCPRSLTPALRGSPRSEPDTRSPWRQSGRAAGDSPRTATCQQQPSGNVRRAGPGCLPQGCLGNLPGVGVPGPQPGPSIRTRAARQRPRRTARPSAGFSRPRYLSPPPPADPGLPQRPEPRTCPSRFGPAPLQSDRRARAATEALRPRRPAQPGPAATPSRRRGRRVTTRHFPAA